MKKKFCILTMVYNDYEMLKIWYNYYIKFTDNYRDIIILNHGSTDETKDNFENKATLINLNKKDNDNNYYEFKQNIKNKYVNELLRDYEFCLVCDCDEIIIPTNNYKNLRDYILNSKNINNYSIGFDVIQNLNNFTKKNFSHLMIFVRAVCKVNLISDKINNFRMDAGQHYSTIKPEFNDLYLFHLRYFNLDLLFKRMEISRNNPNRFKMNHKLDHQSISNKEIINWVGAWSNYTINNDSNYIYTKDFKEKYLSFNIKKDLNNFYKYDYSFRSLESFMCPTKLLNQII